MTTAADLALRVRKILDEKVEEASRKRAQHLNLLAQAFLEETGADPSDVELVEEQTANQIRWYFRRKTDAQQGRVRVDSHLPLPGG